MASTEPATPPDAPPGTDDALESPPAHSTRFDPAALASPLSRRRVATIAGGLVVAWILLAFGRQAGDASAASARAAELRDANAALRVQQAALQQDLARVQGDEYVGISARGYGFGTRHEIPFALAPDAPSLPPDAPGSAALRVGGDGGARSPLEAWLDLLFGPAG